MAAYYNELEPYAAQWLRNLIAAGHIAPGDVDERSIVEVSPDDVRGYTQCHFFAGIGVWSYALRRAGWDDDRSVWTGSCPCQPFSTAGKGKGHEDERHLWPTWFRLIRECRPVRIFGEQVAGHDGRAWLDLVGSDVESVDYALGAVSAPACGFGAYHIRERLYWVADSECGADERQRHDMDGQARGGEGEARQRQRLRAESWASSDAGRLADDHSAGRIEFASARLHERRPGARGEQSAPREVDGAFRHDTARRGSHGGLGDSGGSGSSQQRRGRIESAGSAQASSDARGLGDGERLPHAEPETLGPTRGREEGRAVGEPGGAPNPWSDFRWHLCLDGKHRPVPLEPSLFPLVDGSTRGRVGKLRAAGNAIVAAQAEAFIRAWTELTR